MDIRTAFDTLAFAHTPITHINELANNGATPIEVNGDIITIINAAHTINEQPEPYIIAYLNTP